MGLAGTGTLTFLLLAKQCGVDVDEDMLQSALQHYYRRFYHRPAYHLRQFAVLFLQRKWPGRRIGWRVVFLSIWALLKSIPWAMVSLLRSVEKWRRVA